MYVEVKLKDFGSESVEVVDNGSGIMPDNFSALGICVYLPYNLTVYTLL